jgi:NADH:ubiquinone oxidoreductase subunit 4 (subunit M)
LFNRICFGTLKEASESVSNYTDLNRASFYVFLVLVSAMLILGVYSGVVTDLTNMPIKKILVAFEAKG